jgi:hypothetical protein
MLGEGVPCNICLVFNKDRRAILGKLLGENTCANTNDNGQSMVNRERLGYKQTSIQIEMHSRPSEPQERYTSLAFRNV